MRPILIAALLAGVPAAAQTSINLRDADVRVLIDDVSKVTGASFVIDPRVTGKVSVVSDRPLTRNGYFELFLATMRAQGFAVVPLGGGQYRIAPAEAANAAVARPGGDRFVSAVIPLGTLDAQAAAETVRPFLSRGGAVSGNRAGNGLLIADFADNVARARAALAQLDRDRSAATVVALTLAEAREVAAALTALAAPGEGGRALVTVAAVDASNAVALRGEPGTVARFAALARQLDRRGSGGETTRVIFLQNADAGAILPVLQQLVGQAPTPVPVTTIGGASAANAGSGTPGVQGGQGGSSFAQQAAALSGFSQQQAQQQLPPSALGVAGQGPARRAVIARYEGANALVISAPADVQRRLGDVVRQLDTVRAQVQVEAIIVEISDTAARQLGVQFLLSGTGNSSIPFASANYSNVAPNILAIAGAVAGERGAISNPTVTGTFAAAAVDSLIGPNGITGGTLGFGGKLTDNAVFGFVLNAVRADTASNVLSTPSVLTLDNQPARILVGQEIPITTGEALGLNLTNSFRTVTRQDVGIQLAVRPQISAGGAIKLDIKQIVSSIAGPVAAGSSDLILNKREIETSVTVGDGQILALGGLLDEQERRSIQRVPLLGDIPIVGELFRSRTRSKQKTNLMVFIRPTIVRGREAGDALTAGRWDNLRDEQEGRGDGISSLDALARAYLRTEPPVRRPPEIDPSLRKAPQP